MTDEEREDYLMRRYYEKSIEQLEKWKRDGLTKDEAKIRINRKVLSDDDIDKVYGKDETEENENLEEEKKETIETNTNLEEKEDNNNNANEITKEENYTYNIEDDDINAINKEINYDEEEKYYYNDTQEKTENRVEEKKEENLTEEKDEVKHDNNEIKYLKFEELEDYPDQPFRLYNDAQNEEMIRSIRINGIIQPLIVRPLENGKYQILSGHNRKYCGQKAGIIYYPCKVKKGLTDDEAKLYLVDTNLATREEILPSERARALLMRQSAYRSKRIKEKIEAELYVDVKGNEEGNVRERIQEIENMSTGNL